MSHSQNPISVEREKILFHSQNKTGNYIAETINCDKSAGSREMVARTYMRSTKTGEIQAEYQLYNNI